MRSLGLISSVSFQGTKPVLDCRRDMKCPREHKGRHATFPGALAFLESIINLPLDVLLHLLCDIVFQQDWGKGEQPQSPGHDI